MTSVVPSTEPGGAPYATHVVDNQPPPHTPYDSSVDAALRHQPDLAAVYEPLLTSRVYDPGLRVPTTKRGLLAGMGMTEKQGGSDVRTNSTEARPTAEPGVFTLTGHKWFTSAPMCDLFLVLAQAPG